MLEYQHQWQMEQNMTDNLEVPKVDKNNWANTMKNIVLLLKLMRWVRVVPLAYAVRHHVKLAHISPGHFAYLMR